MSYLVFARKFRPQNFEHVIGQEPIVTTLKNAITQKRIPQNFLFAGPRGVGKTSTARILAKALNCKDGPSAEPCGKCLSCTEITQGNSMDVLEIDGASNRGIDEVRNLRETVKFKPVAGHYKIYIIDEVHMLTTEAFNALLKTLEEPPAHVKFIFATTESYKLPLTILSRCQRYNFKRITASETVEKLSEIAKKEKIKVEPNALYLIAKASDGALRDAEGLLDQLVSFSEGSIKEQDVLFLLGLASESVYFSVLSAIKNKDAQHLFATVKTLYEEGKDLVLFANGLYELFRHLLLFQCADKPEEFMDMNTESIQALKVKKNEFTRGELLLGLNILGNLQNQIRRHMASPRLLIEATLLKLMHLDGLKSLQSYSDSSVPSGLTPRPPVSSPSPQGSSFAPPRSTIPTAPKPTAQSAAVPKTESALDFTSMTSSFAEVETAWPRIIEFVKSKRMSNGIFLSESSPIEITEDVVTLGFPPEFQFHKEMLEKDNSRKLVEEAFEVCLSKKLRVQFVVTKAEKKILEPSADLSGGAPPEDHSKLSEIISEAMNIFEGARIVRKDT